MVGVLSVRPASRSEFLDVIENVEVTGKLIWTKFRSMSGGAPSEPKTLAWGALTLPELEAQGMFTKQICELIGQAKNPSELQSGNRNFFAERLPSTTVQQRQIKKLSARHYEIIELLLSGYRPRDIARSFGLGRQWLSVIMNSPIFLAELHRRIAERFQEIEKLRAKRSIDSLERELYFKINLADAAAEAAGYMREKNNRD
jgi:hypothetical protein